MSFFTPISFQIADHSRSTSKPFSQTLLEKVDDYFYLGGKKACVIKKAKNSELYLFEYKEENIIFFETAVKIASYITLIIPLLFLSVKFLLRSSFSFEDNKVSTAVQTIEKAWKRHLEKERKEKNLLPLVLFWKGVALSQKKNLKNTTVEAVDGDSDVYLPSELEVVLKKTGWPKNIERFEQMIEARAFLHQHSLSYLIIPKARVLSVGREAKGQIRKRSMISFSKDFIIEERLPIAVFSTKERMALYFDNYKLFTNAVKEFTKLLCYTDFEDIVGGTTDPYDTFVSKIPMGRFDNVSPFIQDQKGYLALVDLEELTFPPEALARDLYPQAEKAIALFPLHLQEIMEVVTECKPEMKKAKKWKVKLKKMRRYALKRFKMAYGEHKLFLEKKGISFENPKKILWPNEQEMREICTSWKKRLLATHEIEGKWLGPNPRERQQQMEKELWPFLVDGIYAMLQKFLEEREEELEYQKIQNMGQLAALRSIYLDFESNITDEFVDTLFEKLNIFDVPDSGKTKLLEKITVAFFQELEQREFISYFRPSFAPGSSSWGFPLIYL